MAISKTDERKGAEMIGFGSEIDGYKVMKFTPQGGDHVGTAYMFKPATGCEQVLWTIATVVSDEHGIWHVNYISDSTTDDDEALKK